MQTTSLSIDAVLPTLSPAGREALTEADVVLAVDQATQREFTVFGMPALESTTTLKRLSAMQIVRISFAFDPHRLDELTALMRKMKGLDAGPRAQ